MRRRQRHVGCCYVFGIGIACCCKLAAAPLLLQPTADVDDKIILRARRNHLLASYRDAARVRAANAQQGSLQGSLHCRWWRSLQRSLHCRRRRSLQCSLLLAVQVAARLCGSRQRPGLLMFPSAWPAAGCLLAANLPPADLLLIMHSLLPVTPSPTGSSPGLCRCQRSTGGSSRQAARPGCRGGGGSG